MAILEQDIFIIDPSHQTLGPMLKLSDQNCRAQTHPNWNSILKVRVFPEGLDRLFNG